MNTEIIERQVWTEAPTIEFHEYANIFPLIEGDDFQSLVDSIKRKGLRHPIVLYEGKILDGRNRYLACLAAELKPKFREFTDDDPLSFVLDENKERRDMDATQKAFAARNLIRHYAQLAKERMVAGGSNHTGNQYTKMEGTALVQYLPLDTGEAAEFAAAEMGVSARYVYYAQEVFENRPDLAEVAASGGLNMKEALHQVHDDERQKRRNELIAQAEKIPPSDRWHVYQADMQTWNSPNNAQYDFIITDPPYPKKYLALYERLAERATHWLKSGGLLVVMCGQSYLDEIYCLMSKHIKYYWTGSYFTPGQPKPLRQRQVNTSWKPLLMFANGNYKGKMFGDVFKSDGNDKDFHKWGQSISGMYDIVSKICLPGQSILDPFCGAGTTGIAALRHGCLFDGVDIDKKNVKLSTGRIGDYDNKTTGQPFDRIRPLAAQSKTRNARLPLLQSRSS